jgi:HlyD family secretion protein
MKKFGGRIIGIVLLVLFLATLVFLVSKSRKPAVVYESEKPVIMDIVEKTVTTGSIVPKKEITVKSRVSGIVNEVFVEPGDTVKTGGRVISIKLVPDNVSLNKAELDVKKARIALEQAQADLERQKGLHTREFIADSELEKYTMAYRMAKEDVEWAENNVLLLKEGASKRSGQVSNVVFSPSSGTILEVSVKPGGSVIESNNFNEGTTLASIADMGNLVFEGQLDESEIGKVRLGMELIISVAALSEAKLSAHLDFIAPKGVVNQGAVQFLIKAYVSPPPGLLLRAGYSASADIVLVRAEKALAVREQNVLFEGDKTFVEVGTGGNKFSKREVTVRGTPGHSSMPGRGTAAGALSAVVAAIEKNRFPARLTSLVARFFASIARPMRADPSESFYGS